MTGTMKFFHPDRGYGFIRSPEAGDVFFHVSQYRGEESEIRRGMPVEFELGENSKGVAAVEVTPINGDEL